jgi:glycosyltransferase involved in cell wall biosynthesis
MAQPVAAARKRRVAITVAICTLNRAESLRRTLESLVVMRIPDELGWEVVVVNNYCTDDTDKVIASFTHRLPIRREFERQRGHSSARNRAVDAANGDYIVWTDDDVIVDPGWLAAYVEAFGRWPEAAVFGGPIIPRYITPVPQWIVQSNGLLDVVFSHRDFGAEPLPLSLVGHRTPYGANFAMPAAEHRRFCYNLQLGSRPGQQRLGEDTEVIDRVLASGGIGYWVPGARVEHCIRADRQRIGFVAHRFAELGETDAYLNGLRPISGPLWFGAPRWLWRRMAAGWVFYCCHRLISPPTVWLSYLRAGAFAWGAIRYWRNTRM